MFIKGIIHQEGWHWDDGWNGLDFIFGLLLEPECTRLVGFFVLELKLCHGWDFDLTWEDGFFGELDGLGNEEQGI